MADPASEVSILTADQPFSNHNGGQVLFGPDGFLYVMLGDGGASGDPGSRAQSLADLLGSILRIDPLEAGGYVVPADNPFTQTAGARPEIWSYGLRNPWRVAFDPSNGDLYIADVGERQWEEVDVSSSADGAGKGLNFGWNIMEGPDCFGGSSCDQEGLQLPVLSYDHGEGCSITGGLVYRGAAIPALSRATTSIRTSAPAGCGASVTRAGARWTSSSGPRWRRAAACRASVRTRPASCTS